MVISVNWFANVIRIYLLQKYVRKQLVWLGVGGPHATSSGHDPIIVCGTRGFWGLADVNRLLILLLSIAKIYN